MNPVEGLWRHKQLGFNLEEVAIKKRKILENKELNQRLKDTAKYRVR